MFLSNFLEAVIAYSVEVLPPLAAGLLVSGVIHEFISDEWIIRYLGKKGILPILYATVIGTVAPVCCWGSLPIAVSFYKKGSSLGTILAFLVATPATSVTALLVTWRFFGIGVTGYVFFGVIFMGILVGLLGNALKVNPSKRIAKEVHREDDEHCGCPACHTYPSFTGKVKSALRFGCVQMPKEIGFEVLVGLILAAFVESFTPIGAWIESYLTQGYGYAFAVIFGLMMYMCATASVPLVHAFVAQGLSLGAGLALLVLGPVASAGTILVLRKEFGFKILFVFLGSVSVLCLLLGYWYVPLKGLF